MKNNYLDNENKLQSGFKTPDIYFDDFSKRIMQQLPKDEPKVISLYQRHKSLILSAAAILVMALLIPSLSLFNGESDEFHQVDLETYIVNYSTVSQDDIVDLLEEKDIENLEIDYQLDNVSLENIDLENIDLEQNL